MYRCRTGSQPTDNFGRGDDCKLLLYLTISGVRKLLSCLPLVAGKLAQSQTFIEKSLKGLILGDEVFCKKNKSRIISNYQHTVLKRSLRF